VQRQTCLVALLLFCTKCVTFANVETRRDRRDDQGMAMTGTTFTFRVDPTLKAAFTAMAEEQDLSAAHLLRRMMRDAVEDHDEAAAHERWQQREIDDAMHEADSLQLRGASAGAVESEWSKRKAEIGRSGGA